MYADDLLIVSKSLQEVERVKKMLKLQYSAHDLGDVKDFLGCHIHRDKVSMCICMSCVHKIDALL